MLYKKFVIIGAGPVGLSLALKLASRNQEVVIIDKDVVTHADRRVLALSYASIEFLNELGGFDYSLATAVNKVVISNGNVDTVIQAEDIALNHLGFTVNYTDLCTTLRERVSNNPKITFVNGLVQKVVDSEGFATVFYTDLSTKKEVILTAQYALMAEGGSIAPQSVKFIIHDYKQEALLAKFIAPQFHNHIAYERFTPRGPLVLLPVEQGYTFVWSIDSSLAKEYKANPNTMLEELYNYLPLELQSIQLDSEISSFPLKLKQAKNPTLKHVVLLGNAAQTIHPVSAQGFNIGLRDVREFCQFYFNNPHAGLDKYAHIRSFDVAAVASFTHILATQMDKDTWLTNKVQDYGIKLLSKVNLVQNYIARSLVFGV